MPLLFGKNRRYVILFVCIVETLSMSGILYGWNSLVPVLKKYNVYGHLCEQSNGTSYAPPNVTAKNYDSQQLCSKQDSMLSKAFIVGTSLQLIVAFPVGMFYDRFGLRVTKMTNGVVFFLACLIMAFVSDTKSFLIFPSVCFLSIGASMFLLTNLQIGSLFPAWQYLIISLYSGAFDSSAIMMQLIKFGYRAGISMMTSFLILGVVGVLAMWFIGFFLFPERSMLDGEKPPEPSSAEEADHVKPDGDVQIKIETNEPETNSLSLSAYMLSVPFISQVMWVSCVLLCFKYFLTGFTQHLTFRFGYAGDAAVRERLINALSIFLFAGIIVAPLAGFITDCFKKRFAKGGEVTRAVVLRSLSLAQTLTSIFSLLLCVLMFVPGEYVVYTSYVALVFTRAFLFSLNSAYFLIAFPPQFFGQLFGVCFVIGGVITQVQYALLQLGFIGSSVVLVVVSIISFVHPLRLSGVFKRCCS